MKALINSGPLLIVVAACLWALDGVLRRSLFALPPVTIVFYEHLIGAAILLPWVVKALKKETLTRRDLLLVGIISLLSGLLGTLWFTTALLKVNFIAFSVVFLLQKLQPIFAITSAHLLLKEKITAQYLWWALVALVAAYFVTFPGGKVDLTTGAGTIVAALYALGAAAAWGTSTTFSKMLLQGTSSTLATGLRFIFTTVLAFGAVMLLGQTPSLAQPDPSQFLRFLIIALSTGMVAMVIYYRGLQRTQAKFATLLELAFPVLAILIDVVLYKTVLAPSQYIAALLLMAAIYRIGLMAQRDKLGAKI